jgi:hypothetical protein
VSREVPTWWPPKVGDALRHATVHGTRGSGERPTRRHIKHVDALLHVLSVFEDKDGGKSIVTAEWFPTKRRWNYTVMSALDAEFGLVWPDGAEKPIDRFR